MLLNNPLYPAISPITLLRHNVASGYDGHVTHLPAAFPPSSAVNQPPQLLPLSLPSTDPSTKATTVTPDTRYFFLNIPKLYPSFLSGVL